MSPATIGFARLPKAVRDLLSEAAHTATAAAAALDELARDPTHAAAAAQIVELADDGDRVTHDLQHAVASARVARQERGELLHAIQALDDILDAIDDAARDLPRAGDALPRERLARATAVIRDLVRISVAAVARIEQPPAAREALHERAHELDEELRAELRALHRTVAEHERDVLTALRATGLLRQLRSSGKPAHGRCAPSKSSPEPIHERRRRHHRHPRQPAGAPGRPGADRRARHPGGLYCGGDLVGYGPHPNEVVALIAEHEIPTIYGNYDHAIARDLHDCGCAYITAHDREIGQQSVEWTLIHTDQRSKDWTRELPFDLHLRVGDTSVHLVHGSPRKVNEYLFEDKPASLYERLAAEDDDVLVSGHTHKPWTRSYGGVLFVNCGSVGKPKDGDPRGAFAVLSPARSDVDVRIERSSYDTQAVADQVRDAGLPGECANKLLLAG